MILRIALATIIVTAVAAFVLSPYTASVAIVGGLAGSVLTEAFARRRA